MNLSGQDFKNNERNKLDKFNLVTLCHTKLLKAEYSIKLKCHATITSWPQNKHNPCTLANES